MGYFLLRPLMNELFVSEILTSCLRGCVSVCVCGYVCMCVYVCVSVCVCVLRCGFADTFREEGANLKSGRGLRKGRGEKEGDIPGYVSYSCSISLRWNSSWPSSLLEEPFIYWKERERNTHICTT